MSCVENDTIKELDMRCYLIKDNTIHSVSLPTPNSSPTFRPLCTCLNTAHNLFIRNDAIRLPLAQLLRTAAVVGVQRSVEEITHILNDRSRGNERVLVARGVGCGIVREGEGTRFDELGLLI
jgi:hypothetical protein